MGVDLNFIGTGISAGVSHNGFGGIVSNPASGGGSGFPPAGSYVQTLYGVEYPVELGGEYFANPVTSENVPSQTCDVDELNDGSGGTYLDATSVTNINYIPTATLFATGGDFDASQTPVEVPSGSSNYYDSEFSYTYYYHDGSGSYYTETDHWQYYPNGTFIVNDNSPYNIEVPSGYGNYYNNGKYDRYNWDGSGGVTALTEQGSFYSAGTQIDIITEYQTVFIPNVTPSDQPNGLYTVYRYNWNGTGGYSAPIFQSSGGSYYSNGTYIGEDSTEIFYWDGSGGYYSEMK